MLHFIFHIHNQEFWVGLKCFLSLVSIWSTHVKCHPHLTAHHHPTFPLLLIVRNPDYRGPSLWKDGELNFCAQQHATYRFISKTHL